MARAQRAKWWELRAATDWAGLLMQQGRREEARVLLAPVVAWFSEGFELADLRDAKGLLDALV